MVSRYTNAEWAAIVDQTDREVKVSQQPYVCPDVGSPAFAKTIDHTLLKLDVRAVQFDELCAEARVDGFAVGDLPLRNGEETNVSTDRLCSPSVRCKVQG